MAFETGSEGSLATIEDKLESSETSIKSMAFLAWLIKKDLAAPKHAERYKVVRSEAVASLKDSIYDAFPQDGSIILSAGSRAIKQVGIDLVVGPSSQPTYTLPDGVIVEHVGSQPPGSYMEIDNFFFYGDATNEVQLYIGSREERIYTSLNSLAIVVADLADPAFLSWEPGS